MKRLLVGLAFLLLLSSCSAPTYTAVSENPVDGYIIYKKDNDGPLCNSYYEDVYYSGEVYNYGFRFKACSPEMTFYIIVAGEYMYLKQALDEGIITIDSLLPELDQLERNPEEFSSEDADYYWLDFHINGEVVYAYAGGECDQAGSETFIINGTTYYYSASGCLQEHILYMRIDGEEIPIADLINDGTIDGEYLIPLLTESSN